MTNAIQFERLRRPIDAAGDGPPDGPSRLPVQGPSERSQRAAAEVRYQAFAAGGTGASPRLCTGCATHPAPAPKPEAKTESYLETIPNSVLYRTEAGEASSINRNDIRQGQLWDCYFLASLAGVASTPEGQALIQRSIRENRNDRGDVTSYTVTLHRPGFNLCGLLPTRFTEVQVTVDASFVPGHAVAREDGGFREIWPLVMERAYAQYLGDDHALDHTGGRASQALEILTGRPATGVGAAHYSPERLESDFHAGRIIVLDTKVAASETIGVNSVSIRTSHAYLVTGIQPANGDLTVELFDPWNKIVQVPYSKLRPYLDRVNLGTVR